jgi:hypothetical protein
MSRRSRRDDRQQRQDDSNRQKHEARHKHTVDGRLLGGDSNLSAQSSATASGSLAKRPLRAGIRAIARLGGPDVAAMIWDSIEAKRGKS